MRQLFTIDLNNYVPSLPRVYRPSVRAIIRRSDLLAMVPVQKRAFRNC